MLTQFKVGLAVGLTFGQGFVVKRLANDGRWSAPCYLELQNASVGFTLGEGRRRQPLTLKRCRPAPAPHFPLAFVKLSLSVQCSSKHAKPLPFSSTPYCCKLAGSACLSP